MSTTYYPLSSLAVSVFSLNSTSLLAVCKGFKIGAENTLADAAGIADRYELNIPVKQSQKLDFTVFQLNGSSVADCNLDVSLWSIGGTAYLNQLRGGSINATTVTKERSSIASLTKNPNANRTQVEITTDLLIVEAAALTNTIIAGTTSAFNVAAAITFGTTVFTCPMILKAGTISIERGEMQMENVSLSLAGTPTGPSDSSLLGEILLGTTIYAIDVDTGTTALGGSTYTSSSAMITRLNTRFADAAIVEQEGTMELQGTFTVADP